MGGGLADVAGSGVEDVAGVVDGCPEGGPLGSVPVEDLVVVLGVGAFVDDGVLDALEGGERVSGSGLMG